MKIEKFDPASIDNAFVGNIPEIKEKPSAVYANIKRFSCGYAWLLEIDFPYSDIIKEKWSEDMKSVYYSQIEIQLKNKGGYNVPYLEEEFKASYFYKKCIHCGHYDHCEASDGGSQNDWF